ncbi:MAG: hypothetical protein RMM31_08555 [Anaerolineae bacterium]|nr:hypothetical protein [Anaerolineae bacterium]
MSTWALGNAQPYVTDASAPEPASAEQLAEVTVAEPLCRVHMLRCAQESKNV